MKSKPQNPSTESSQTYLNGDIIYLCGYRSYALLQLRAQGQHSQIIEAKLLVMLPTLILKQKKLSFISISGWQK